ncbi:MAG: orotate phosphoribosyltransferase [Gemmatimonadales bacterium]|nr:orotate phosphoribosyltransferase [Gemmatimonadales bacterium]
MAEPILPAFLDLVDARRGHFQLESGHHGELWLDLDALFANPGRIAPFVAHLTDQLRRHAPDVICGPLLGGAFLAQLVAHALDVEFCFTESRAADRADRLYQIRYELPRAYRGRVRGRRVAMVDDVMSAGSALRGTYAELLAHGAVPVAAAALLILGDVGAGFFTREHVAVEGVARGEYQLWTPDECPRCAAGQPLGDLGLPAG